MIWIILGAVCAFIGGFNYGRLVGINLMLQLGADIYPDFKKKVTEHVMYEAKK